MRKMLIIIVAQPNARKLARASSSSVRSAANWRPRAEGGDRQRQRQARQPRSKPAVYTRRFAAARDDVDVAVFSQCRSSCRSALAQIQPLTGYR